MIEVSARDFRARPGRYYKSAARGERVIVRTRDNGAFQLIPFVSDTPALTEDDLIKRYEAAKEQIAQGGGYTWREGETAEEFVERL